MKVKAARAELRCLPGKRESSRACGWFCAARRGLPGPAAASDVAEQRLDPLVVAARQGQLGAVLEQHALVGVEQRRQLAHPVEVDDGRAVDAHEALRVEL